MPRVVLVRHGEAEGEASQRFLGRSDVPLSERGIAQTVALESRLPDLDITVLVTSPLRRARQTADLIGRVLDLTPEIRENLTELDFGRWTGHTADDLLHQEPATYAAWLDHPETVEPAGGETLVALRGRVSAAVEDLLADYPEDANLLIVTHDHVGRSLLTLLLGLGPERHWQIDLDPGSISVFERRAGMFYLTLLNETCQLGAQHALDLVIPSEG